MTIKYKLMCTWCGVFEETAISDYCYIDALMLDIKLVVSEYKNHNFQVGKIMIKEAGTDYFEDAFNEY